MVVQEERSYLNGRIWRVETGGRVPRLQWRANCYYCRKGPWFASVESDVKRTLEEHECVPPWDPEHLSGGKRCNIEHGSLGDWWVGYGKSDGCQIEGPWHHWANLAAQILSHPNTEKVAPNLYQPELIDVVEDLYSEASTLDG